MWRITCDYLLAFFDKHLNNMKVPLLDGPSPAYPEVFFGSPVIPYEERKPLLFMLEHALKSARHMKQTYHISLSLIPGSYCLRCWQQLHLTLLALEIIIRLL